MVNDTAQLTDHIRRRAKSLGFTHVGCAPAGAMKPEGDRLREWLGRGYQAGMGWMERDPTRRTDPREILPGAQSVIAVAMNYYVPEHHEQDPDAAKISRYAWGDDYHDIIDARLKNLEEEISALSPDANTRRYVDTGPVMDKAWAVRAGIGWLGKHSNVITRDMGSWVFLGEILTTLSLAYDEPIQDYCGTCTACLEACPTGAIVEPYVVDANRCISYLTIEHRGETIPGAERWDFENWVFGCDICQDVCPWNSFAQPTGESGYEPRAGNVHPSLRALADIDDDEFRERYRNSPVKRCKPSGMRRNARTVLAQRESHSDR